MVFMRNGVDYTKKDEVILETLSSGLVEDSFVLHQDSTYDVDKIKLKLDQIGVHYVNLFDAWNLSYRMFASKNENKVERVAQISAAVWDNIDKSKELLLETYSIILPDCCLERFKVDIVNKINSQRRYALQLLDLSRKYTRSAIDEFEEDLHIPTTEKEKMIEEGREKRKVEKVVDVDEYNRNIFSDNNKASLFENLNVIGIAVYNTRLSREIPMCEPTCSNVFKKYTSGRLQTLQKLGYNVGDVSENVGNFVESVFYSHYWGEKNVPTDELEKMIKSLKLEKISKIIDLEKSRVGDDVVDLKRSDETVIGVPIKFGKKREN